MWTDPALSGCFPLRKTRVHEVCGPGAAAFCALAAASGEGPVLWVVESHRTEGLNPVGLAPLLAPERVLTVRTGTQTDSLAVAEEALKDGAAPFVAIEISAPLDLREGRRLQLAARAGGTTGLCLIPEGMGSNAAETRWRAAALFDATGAVDSTLMRWEIIKNKEGTIRAWHVRWTPETGGLHVVPPVAERPGSQGASG